VSEGERIFSKSSGTFYLKEMADLKLDILVIPTYNTYTLGVADASTYPTNPPVVSAPTITIIVPTFGEVTLPFNVNDFNVFTSTSLGITAVGEPMLPLPDGVYTLTYTVAPSYDNTVTKTIMRTEIIQEKFDKAFMKLDMMECDRAIKTQQKVDLNSIYFFIQGSIAAANNCAIDEANKLYVQADKMLNNFIKNNCGCSGNNYAPNFY
jgi:hypothetical protein